MRTPEPPYPSFAQVMLTAYPVLAPLLFPPSRSSQETCVEMDAWSFNSEEDTRRSFDDVFMHTVDYRDMESYEVPAAQWDDMENNAVAVRGGDRDLEGDDTFTQLQYAMSVRNESPPTRHLVRRRLSALIVDLAAKVVSKLKSRSSSAGHASLSPSSTLD